MSTTLDYSRSRVRESFDAEERLKRSRKRRSQSYRSSDREKEGTRRPTNRSKSEYLPKRRSTRGNVGNRKSENYRNSAVDIYQSYNKRHSYSPRSPRSPRSHPSRNSLPNTYVYGHANERTTYEPKEYKEEVVVNMPQGSNIEMKEIIPQTQPQNTPSQPSNNSDTNIAIDKGKSNLPPGPPPGSKYNTVDGRHPYYRWIVLFSSTIAILLVSIQQNALLVALPDLIAGLDAGFVAIIWVLLVFGLFIVAITLAVGAISDMLGRCRMFNFGFIFFVLGCLLCGFANKDKVGWDLVGYRVIQAFGGTFLFSNSGAILTDAFFPYNQVGLAMGVNQVASAFGSILGPVLGGVLSSVWRWLFFMNVPVGGVAAILSLLFIRERGNNTISEDLRIIKGKLYFKYDWIGAICSFAAVSAILLSLISSAAIPTIPQNAWIALYVVGFFFGVAFFLNEKYLVFWWKNKKDPLLHMNLFTNKTFVIANVASLTAGFSRSVVLITSILFLQGPYKMDPYHAGIATMPLGIGILLSGFLSGIISDKYGRKLLQIVGPLVAALGGLGLALVKLNTNYWWFALGLFITGLGQALYGSPNGAMVMMSVPPASRGVAAGVRTWLFMLANTVGMIGAFGIAIGKLPYDALLVLFLYGEGDPTQLPPGTNLDQLNETIVSTLSVAYWMAFATVLFSGLISFVLPGKMIEIKRDVVAVTQSPSIQTQTQTQTPTPVQVQTVTQIETQTQTPTISPSSSSHESQPQSQPQSLAQSQEELQVNPSKQ